MLENWYVFQYRCQVDQHTLTVGVQTCKNVTIDPTKSFPKSFSTADASVRAVLVYKEGAAGAVRVTGSNTPQPVPNVVTGTDETGLEIIEVKEGQTCMFFGNPAVRYFRCKEA
jgi:hypothetical protein